jgi:hypothetical protein
MKMLFVVLGAFSLEKHALSREGSTKNISKKRKFAAE